MSNIDFDDDISGLLGKKMQPLPDKAVEYIETIQQEFLKNCPACGGNGYFRYFKYAKAWHRPDKVL